MSETDLLVQNAVNFLQDPSVQNTPISSRISFLEKKGLSSAQIDQALSKAGLQRESGEPAINVGNIQHLTAGPRIPSSGPSKALTSLVTNEGFSWSRLMLYVALVGGAAATFNVATVSKWTRNLYRRLVNFIIILIYGEDSSYKLSPSVSIDRLAEIKQELSDLKATVGNLSEKVETTVFEEMQQVKSTLKLTYARLEGELEELKASIDQVQE